MAIKVIVEKVLEDWWGAEDFLEAGGEEALIDGILEDVSAFLDGAIWTIERPK